MNELQNSLTQRALSALFNPSEVTEEIVSVAVSEALELTENKPIPRTMLLDLAYARLKLYLKVPIEPLEEKLATNAIKRANEMQIDKSTGKVKRATMIAKVRRSFWDMPIYQCNSWLSEECMEQKYELP